MCLPLNHESMKRRGLEIRTLPQIFFAPPHILWCDPRPRWDAAAVSLLCGGCGELAGAMGQVFRRGVWYQVFVAARWPSWLPPWSPSWPGLATQRNRHYAQTPIILWRSKYINATLDARAYFIHICLKKRDMILLPMILWKQRCLKAVPQCCWDGWYKWWNGHN